MPGIRIVLPSIQLISRRGGDGLKNKFNKWSWSNEFFTLLKSFQSANDICVGWVRKTELQKSMTTSLRHCKYFDVFTIKIRLWSSAWDVYFLHAVLKMLQTRYETKLFLQNAVTSSGQASVRGEKNPNRCFTKNVIFFCCGRNFPITSAAILWKLSIKLSWSRRNKLS